MNNVTIFNPKTVVKNIKDSKAYIIREKLNNGMSLSRDEKNYITTECNCNGFFKDSIAIWGWRVYFGDILNTYVVRQYGQWQEYKAIDKTSLRHYLNGRIEKIVEVF